MTNNAIIFKLALATSLCCVQITRPSQDAPGDVVGLVSLPQLPYVLTKFCSIPVSSCK